MDVMSYTDSPRTRVDPAGLGGAFLMSGVIVIGIATAAPNVVTILRDPPIIITRIFDPPAPPKPVDKPVEHKAGPVDKGKPAASAQTGSNAKSDNDLTASGSGSGGEVVIPGPGPDIILPPPALPVRTTATFTARNAAQPPYPRSLQAEGIEGVAVVRVLVGTDGRVKAVDSVRADDPLFFEATREHALRKWRFSPATEDGRAVESWREMTVRFVIPR
jgi:protein TonB